MISINKALLSILVILFLNNCSTLWSLRSEKKVKINSQPLIEKKVLLNTNTYNFYLHEGDRNYSALVLPMHEKVNLLLTESFKEINLFENISLSEDKDSKLQITATLVNKPVNFLISILSAIISGATLQIIPWVSREKQMIEIRVYEDQKEIYINRKEEILYYYSSVWIALFIDSKRKSGDMQKTLIKEQSSAILNEFYEFYKKDNKEIK